MEPFLSQTAEYALRAMAWFAIHAPDGSVRARDLSQATGIPAHYLSKILRRLVIGGVLESQKGQGGGFRLARPPQEIRFRDILAAVDAFPERERCAFGWGACDASRPCPLHDSWFPMSRAFDEWASSTTLAQVGVASGRSAEEAS